MTSQSAKQLFAMLVFLRKSEQENLKSGKESMQACFF
jgi:hypothetical protein